MPRRQGFIKSDDWPSDTKGHRRGTATSLYELQQANAARRSPDVELKALIFIFLLSVVTLIVLSIFAPLGMITEAGERIINLIKRGLHYEDVP